MRTEGRPKFLWCLMGGSGDFVVHDSVPTGCWKIDVVTLKSNTINDSRRREGTTEGRNGDEPKLTKVSVEELVSLRAFFCANSRLTMVRFLAFWFNVSLVVC